MDYTNADVFVYQILNCLIGEYDYKIVNVANAKKDLWLASTTNMTFPIIRLNAQITSSSMFESNYLNDILVALNTVLAKKSKVLIINTNDKSQPFNEGNFNQMILSDWQCTDEKIYKYFPKLKQAIYKTENNQAECAKLTKELEQIQMKKLKQARKFSLKKLPPVSTAISAIMFICFALSYYLVLQYSEYLAVGLVAAGAYYKSLVLQGYEYFRFITMTFIHPDLITLLFYSFMLIQIGQLCEKEYGKLRYLLIFVTAALVGNLLPYIFQSNTIFMGMGSGVMGLLGALFVLVVKRKLYLNKLIMLKLSNVYLWIFVCFIMEGVSSYSLIGGFIWGLFFSIAIFPTEEFKQLRPHFIICCILLLMSLGYGMSKITIALPNSEFDENLVSQYEVLGLKEYSIHLSEVLDLKGE